MAAEVGPEIGVRGALCLDTPHRPPVPSRFKGMPDVRERAPGTKVAKYRVSLERNERNFLSHKPHNGGK